MNDYLQRVNSAPFYGIVAGVLGFITIMCFVFLMKSYRAGLRIGMDKRVLKKPSCPAPPLRCCLPSASCWEWWP